jgi:hypothetical protein
VASTRAITLANNAVFNKMNNHLSPHIIKNKKDHDNIGGKSSSWISIGNTDINKQYKNTSTYSLPLK